MSLQVGTLAAVLRLDTTPYEQGMASTDATARAAGGRAGQSFGGRLTSSVRSAMGGVMDIMSSTATAGATVAGGLLATSLAKGFGRMTTIEDATSALTIALGDAAAAGRVLDDVLEVVRGTPFNLDQFAAAAQQLVGFGVAADKVPVYLTAIGEAAATQGKRAGEFADRLSTVFGQIAASGQVSLADVWRISDTGVNALAILANHFNLSRDAMKDMISSGAVPAGEALDALARGIVDGSDGPAGATVALAGTMEQLRLNTSGAVAGIMPAMARLGVAILGVFSPDITAGANAITDSIDALAAKAGNWAEQVANSPALARFRDWIAGLPDVIDRVGDRFRILDGIAGPLAATLGAMGVSGLAGALGPLGALLGPLGRLNPLLVGLGTFFASSPEFRRVLQDLAEAARPLAETLAGDLGEALTALAEAAIPLVVGALELLVPVVGWLADHASIVAPVLLGLVGAALAVAHPFAGIVGAALLVVAGLKWAYEHIDWFSGAVDAAWSAITSAIEAAVGWLQGVDWAGIWSAITEAMQPLAEAAVWLNEKVFQPVWQGMQGAWDDLMTGFRGGDVAGVFGPIGEGIGIIYDDLTGLVGAIAAIDWADTWASITSGASDIWSRIGSVDDLKSTLATIDWTDIQTVIADGLAVAGDWAITEWAHGLWDQMWDKVAGVDVGDGVWSSIVAGAGAVAEFTRPAVETISDIVNNVGEQFSNLADWARENWENIQTTIVRVLTVIGAIIAGFVMAALWWWDRFGETIIANLQNVWNIVASIVEIGLSTIRTLIEVVTSVISGDWAGAWDALKEHWSLLWEQIGSILSNAGQILFRTLGAALSALWDLVWWGLGALYDQWRQMPGRIIELLRNLGPWLFRNGLEWWGRLQAAAAEKALELLVWAMALPGRITEAIGSLGSTLLQAGRDLMQGLIEGIKEKAGNLADEVLGPVTGVVESVKNFLGINSPSRLMAQIGRFTVAGLAQGIDQERRLPGMAMGRVLSDLHRSADIQVSHRLTDRASGGLIPTGLEGRPRGDWGGDPRPPDRPVTFGDTYVDARGIQDPQEVADLTSRHVAWRLAAGAPR